MKKRGEISLEDAIALRDAVGEPQENEQFMRRLRLRGSGKLCTVIYVHKQVEGRFLGCVHMDNTPRDKAAAVSWQ